MLNCLRPALMCCVACFGTALAGPADSTAFLNKPAPIAAPSLPARLLPLVTPENCMADVSRLAEFGTRHTLSDTESATRGIGAARAWVLAKFQSLSARIRVSLEEFTAPTGPRIKEPAKVANVVAVIPGTDPAAAARRVYVVGHLDSINADVMNARDDAPGANDDASGCAVVLECARAVAGADLRATVVFLCTIGEEQGLVGAKYHADGARTRGENIIAVLNNDIVGDPASPGEGFAAEPGFVRVFSEGLLRNATAENLARLRALSGESDSPSRELARFIAETAEREHLAVRPRLVFRLDRFLRGGDHSMFNEAGFAAVRFTASNETYSRQHQNVTSGTGPDGRTIRNGDLPGFVDAAYLAGVARVNLAALVHLANAPAAPGNVRVVTAKLENQTTLRWEASPDADGYEVVWRATTSPTWEFAHDVGGATSATLPISKDDYFLGVRAYRKDGYRCPVVFAGQARE